MTTLTDYLAQVKNRAQGATPGPWEVEVPEPTQGDGLPDFIKVVAGTAIGEPGSWIETDMIVEFDTYSSEPSEIEERRKQAEFIAASRTDVPTLAAMVERVLELVAELEVAAVRNDWKSKTPPWNTSPRNPYEALSISQAQIAEDIQAAMQEVIEGE